MDYFQSVDGIGTERGKTSDIGKLNWFLQLKTQQTHSAADPCSVLDDPTADSVFLFLWLSFLKGSIYNAIIYCFPKTAILLNDEANNWSF